MRITWPNLESNENIPNIAFLQSLIEGKIPRKKLPPPLIKANYKFVLANELFGFYLNDSFCSFQRIKNSIITKPNYKIIFAHQKFLPELCYQDKLKARFFYKEFIKHTPYSDEIISKEYKLFEVDKNLINRCHWGSTMISLYGSIDAFLNNARGLCLVKDKLVVCEAYAVKSNAYAEIGTVTHERFRNIGLSTHLTAILTGLCYDEGYTVTWSCDCDNYASKNVAEKIGFYKPEKYFCLIT